MATRKELLQQIVQKFAEYDKLAAQYPSIPAGLSELNKKNLDGIRSKLAPILKPATPATPSNPETHVVAAGETLIKLAEKFGVSEADLKTANPDKLKTWGTVQGFNAGETIKIPKKNSAPVEPVKPVEPVTPPAPVNPATHVVAAGETLIKLAAKFGVSEADLKAANPDKLKTWGATQGFNAGETIKIPKKGSAPAQPNNPITPVTPVTPPANGAVTNVLQATEIKKTGDWADRADAKKITATPAEVSAFIGKCNQPGSPTQLPVKPKTKVTTFAEEFKYLEGTNAVIGGKSEVPRPPMFNTSNGAGVEFINKAYGTVVTAHVGENGALDTPAARKSQADFEAANIIKISLPYTLYYDGKAVNSMRLNKKVASSMASALAEVLAFYGADMIAKLGMNIYGGAFVYRKMRGGSQPSIHAWGCAVDFCQQLNGLKDKGDNALFSQAPYAAFMDIMEKHGWYNQGRGKGSDFMHFQAVSF